MRMESKTTMPIIIITPISDMMLMVVWVISRNRITPVNPGRPGGADGLGAFPAGSKSPEAERVVALRKPRAAIVGHERAVIEPGGREPQRAVDQQLPEGRPDQILAADYLGDPHAGVVHGAGQLVAWAVVLAPDREVAEIPARDGALGPEPSVVEREFLAVGHAQGPVDTDRVPDGGDRRAGIGAECGRIDGFVVGAALVGGAGGLDDVAPRPRARVDEAGPAEALQGGAVQGPPPALVVGRVGTSHVGALVPREPQPAQVGEHGLREIHPVALRVQIVAAQDEGAARIPGAPGRDPERAGVPEVEVAGRGGGEAAPVWGGGAQGFGFIFGRRAPSWRVLSPWQSSCASTAARPRTSSPGTTRPPRRSAAPWSQTDGAWSTAAATSG